jgi:hypothetical protein
MSKLKDQIVELIGEQAEQEARQLAGEFARAASEDRELILAQLQYEQWLAETCWECLS